MPEDSQPKRDLAQRGVVWIFALLSSTLAGISINVISGDAGYRWTAIGWAVYGVLFGAWRLRQVDARIPAVHWFIVFCAATAGLVGATSLITPPDWRPYQVIVAVALGAAAVIAASTNNAGLMAVGMLLVGGGIAYAGHGVTGADGVFAALVRTGFGLGIAVVGGLLLRGWIQACGVAMVVVGVFSLTVAMVFLVAGGVVLLALVFGSIGAGGIMIGTALARWLSSPQDVAAASIRPIAASLALLYLSLGVIAILDDRVVLAVADVFPPS
jgi:hypothetical protein